MYDDLYEFLNNNDLVYRFLNDDNYIDRLLNEIGKELENHNNDCEDCEFYDECSEANDDKIISDNDVECDDDCDNCEFNPDNILNNDVNDNDNDEDFNDINHPYHYASHGVETIDKIEAVVAGLPARAAVLLGNVIKYVDRAGYKDDAAKDLAKANAYAHRLVYGRWPE